MDHIKKNACIYLVDKAFYIGPVLPGVTKLNTVEAFG
jgi:hypothetical protein